MNAKILLAAGALVIGLNVPAMASIGCKPGNASATTKATDCGPDDARFGTYSLGSPATIAAPRAYAYAPAARAYAYDPYPATYDSHVPLAGMHLGPFGFSFWAH